MTVAADPLDVFLIHGPRDRGIASIVRAALSDAGLDVYAVDHLKADEPFLSEFRSAMGECSASLLILTRSTLESQDVAVAIGAAMASNTPVYVLYDGIAPREIPAWLREFEIAPLAKLGWVVAEIAKSREPLSEQQRLSLVRVYETLGIPADQLVRRPVSMRELWNEFRDETNAALPAKRLVEELFRLRKQGALPTLSRKNGE
jgi:TIR domain